jgi:glutamate transport system substrate-binding protein
MVLRTLSLLLVALVLTSCIPPEPDDDLIRSFDPEETVMGAIQERGTLRIGIDEAFVPPNAKAGGVYSFAVSLGEEVGRALGVEPEGWEFSVGSTSSLLHGIEDDTYDIVFPAVPVTEDRIKSFRRTHSFTDPYLVAHQRLLTPSGSGQVAGGRVCSFADEQTGAPLGEVLEGATIGTAGQAFCAEALSSGSVDAISGPDIILAGLAEASDGSEVTGDQLNTEGYSAVVEAGAGAWTDYVGQVIEEAQQEGRWSDYFKAYLAPGLQEEQEPPGMSVEEAAALFPSDATL